MVYLNSHGYVASWERSEAGYLLHTCNCPYEALAGQNQELCAMDLALASNLVGRPVQRRQPGHRRRQQLLPTWWPSPSPAAAAGRTEHNLAN